MSDDLTIGSVEAGVEEDAIVVRVELTNDSDRTLHAYSAARRLDYDPATGVLDVGLTDIHADTTGDASTFVLPAFTAVDPHSRRTLELRLPRVVTRIGGVNDQGAPVIVRIPVHEATEARVEVSWSDTPFYRDPRPVRPENAHPVAQLRTWQQGLATATAPLSRAAGAD